MHNPDWCRVSTCGGYPAVYCPEHPRAWSTGYVHVHIIVAETKIGRLLCPTEVVHHIDEDRFNNNPDNLAIIGSLSEHARIHARRNQIKLACPECNKEFYRMGSRCPGKTGNKNAFCSRSCAGKHSGFKHREKITNFRHGTKNGYNYHKCRCSLCREANAAERRRQRRSPRNQLGFLNH